MAPRQGHGLKLSYYDFGRTTFYAAKADQRFSYCLYVPEDYDETGDKTYSLAVTVHGTGRSAAAYRDGFADFADANDCIVLAPLFPAGIIEEGELSNYKLLQFHDIRFDLVLLSIVDEVAAKYRVDASRFLLYGFSGGGHFTHRFLYVHPERLLGASIGAPGVVTLLDPTRDWWVGVRDLQARFGKPLNLEAMRRVAVHMVIGDKDTETWEITIRPDDAWWMEGADLAGANRIDRMRSLRQSFEKHGIAVRQDIVPGVDHDPPKVIGPVKAFFADVLRRHRSQAQPTRAAG
ncbi:MAG TPA: alpha/beta hydrolase [Dongiaceae bacterium]|jgi:pimeloyl-ACP methyl ester carboxylesterase